MPAAKGPGSLALTWQRRHKPDCSSARWPGQVCAAAASPDGGGLGLVGLMASLMQQAQQQVGPARSQAAGAGVLTQGATLDVASLHYHPAGGHFPVSADMARLSGPCRPPSVSALHPLHKICTWHACSQTAHAQARYIQFACLQPAFLLQTWCKLIAQSSCSMHPATHSNGLISRFPLLLAPAGAQLPLLQDVSLHLPANQLGLIYGRSGAGKTTLLQLIAGLAEPTTGAISVTAPAAGTAAGNGAVRSFGARGSKFAQLKAAEAAKRQGGAVTHPPPGNGAAAGRAAESGEKGACSRWMLHCIING